MKKEGNINWENFLATRALPWVLVHCRQVGSDLTWDSTASQEASVVLPNSTPSWENIVNSQEGSNSPASNSSNNTRSQAGNISASSSHAVKWSARLRASQADNTIPQADSEVYQSRGALPLNTAASQATSSAGSQEAGALSPTNNNTQAGSRSGKGNRHSVRPRAFQASQGNTATSQASSAGTQGGNTSPSNNIRANNPQGSSSEGPNPKWVINMSSKPLTQAQRFVLAKGPNFAVPPGILLT